MTSPAPGRRATAAAATREQRPDQPAGAGHSQGALAAIASKIGNRATGALLRAPSRGPKPQVDPRATPGHRDPLYKVPETGDPFIEQISEDTRSISWSWEVERPGTPLTGGMPFREQVYWATFEVDAEGVMRVSARMVSPSGFRAPEWTLRSKFKEALEVFRRGGVEVRAFEAEWGYMGPGEISHNLDAFFQNLKKNPGMQLAAASGTPSGKVATENGFTEVQIVSEPGYQVSQVTGHTGISESRPVVRVRFAAQGTPLPEGVHAPSTAPAGAIERPPMTTTLPIERPAIPARRIPTGVKAGIGWGIQIGLFVFFWWAGRERAKQQEAFLKDLQSKRIDPAIDAALHAQASEGYRLHNAAPDTPMYANVTIDFKEEWDESGIAGERVGGGISDANFVSLQFGYAPVQSETQGDKERESFFVSQNSHYTQITRVISPMLVYHPDHEEYKRLKYERWEGWTKAHPEWSSMNPSPGQVVEQSDSYYWVHQRHGIQEWIQSTSLKRIRDELGLNQEKQPTVTVIR